MKICPECQTKYTDDTLNFCLQDGKTLDSVTDEKTLVLDADSFAEQATIADSVETLSREESEKKKEFTDKRVVVPTLDNPTRETLVNRESTRAAESDSSNFKSAKTGLSFVGGFFLAFILLGLIGSGLFFAWRYSQKGAADIAGNTNTNSNSIKETILSDSNKVEVSSSSTRRNDKGNSYLPKLAFDGNPRTAWAEGARGAGVGQWIAFDFEKEVTLKKLIIMPGYFKTPELWNTNNRLSSAILEFSDKLTKTVHFPNKMEQQEIDLGGIKTKSVLIKIKGIYPGRTDRKDTLISEVSFVVE